MAVFRNNPCRYVPSGYCNKQSRRTESLKYKCGNHVGPALRRFQNGRNNDKERSDQQENNWEMDNHRVNRCPSRK